MGFWYKAGGGTSWSDGSMQMKRDEINLNGGLAREKDNRGRFEIVDEKAKQKKISFDVL